MKQLLPWILAGLLSLGVATTARADDWYVETFELETEVGHRLGELDNLANPTQLEKKEQKKLRKAFDEFANFSAPDAQGIKSLAKIGRHIRKSNTQDPEVLLAASDVLACLPKVVANEVHDLNKLIPGVLNSGKRDNLQKSMGKVDLLLQEGLALLGQDDVKAEKKLLQALKKVLRVLANTNKALEKQFGSQGGNPFLQPVEGDATNTGVIGNVSAGGTTRTLFIRSAKIDVDIYSNGVFQGTVSAPVGQVWSELGEQVDGYGISGMQPGFMISFGEVVLAAMIQFPAGTYMQAIGRVEVRSSYKRKGGKVFKDVFPIDTGPVPF